MCPIVCIFRTIVHGRRPSRRIPSRFEHGGKLTWKTPEILHFSGLTSKLFRIIPRWKFSNVSRSYSEVILLKSGRYALLIARDKDLNPFYLKGTSFRWAFVHRANIFFPSWISRNAIAANATTNAVNSWRVTGGSRVARSRKTAGQLSRVDRCRSCKSCETCG